MIEQDIPKNQFDEYYHFLKELELFANLKDEDIKTLLNSMKVVTVVGKETIIHEGELNFDLYIVVQGKLLVCVEDPLTKESKFIAEIPSGQVVGEIASITKEPRTATVKASRDSVLLKVHQEFIEVFQKQCPAASFEIAKMALKRLIKPRREFVPGERIHTLVVAPAGKSDHHSFCEELVEEFRFYGKTAFVTQSLCREIYGCEITQMSEPADSRKLIELFLRIESENQYLIIETDRELTPWSEICLRCSDHVLFVADDVISPALNSIETYYFDIEHHDVQNFSDLILIHRNEKFSKFKAADWLENRPVKGHYHVNMDAPNPLKSLVRILTNNSFAVVLNGGGARGLSHIGVLKALEESGMKIDFLGGSSFGSFAGAGYVIYGVEGALEQAEILTKNFRRDYTFPYLSLLKGKTTSESLQKLCGDLNIEDLPTPFFCVSCNLTNRELTIHERGRVWEAVRKSISIPGIYPPLYDDEGCAYVDGGVMNNMPVDVMRKKIRGGKILAIKCSSMKQESFFKSYPEAWKSGWEILKNNIMGQNKTEHYDSILNLLLTSMTLASETHEDLMCEAADYLIKIDSSKYGILDFKDCKKIIQVGYEQGKEQIENFDFFKNKYFL